MTTFEIILLILGIVIFIIPSIIFNFTATSEQKQEIKDYETAFKQYRPQYKRSFLGIF